MIKLIENKIKGEKITGIIPLITRDLKANIVQKSFTINFGHWVICALISIVLVALGILLFKDVILKWANPNKIVGGVIMVIGVLTVLLKQIYQENIREFPVSGLVLSDKGLYFFIIKGFVQNFVKIEDNTGKLNEIIYGEINENSKKIGENIQIKKNGRVLISGKINILSSGELVSQHFKKEDILPTFELQKIYLGYN